MLKSIVLFSIISAFSFNLFAKGKVKVVDPSESIWKLAPINRTAKLPGEGVYYSLFVRSFADSDGDGIGDFKGLLKRLDYLNDGKDETTDDLGITGLWLLPVFETKSYHGYDVSDYYKINPEYGTMADFEAFLSGCKERGISVIVDMTCNHSSYYNDWFTQSKELDSPYRSWYRWISDEDTTKRSGKYNINQKIWGHNVWNIDMSHEIGENAYYYAGLFSPQMPEFNMDEPAVREEFKKVFKFWMDKGVTGFRFDAAGHIYNVAEVVPGAETISKSVAFWKEMNDYITSVNPDAYCVAEVWDNSATRAQFLGGMQSNFHFDLGTLIANVINNQESNDNNGIHDEDSSTYNGYARSLENEYKLYARYNENYIDAPFLSNHDQARSCAALRNKLSKMKLAADMYILAEGIPFIYYGEEIGMKSGSDDPSKRTPFVWKPEGKDRLTTSWCNNVNYGNISAYNKKTVPVSVQQKDEASLLTHYKRVIRVKTAHPALYKGRLKAVGTGSEVLESYVMECPEEKAFVIHNVSSSRTETVQIPEGCALPLVYAANPGVVVEDGKITVPPMTSVVLAETK